MPRIASDELTIPTAAALVNRSSETIRRWVWSGHLKARKSGKRLLVSRSDLEALMSARDADAPLDFRAWCQLADDLLPRPKAGGWSASDLVLADRRARSSDDAGR